jgi:hypothetical protein
MISDDGILRADFTLVNDESVMFVTSVVGSLTNDSNLLKLLSNTVVLSADGTLIRVLVL